MKASTFVSTMALAAVMAGCGRAPLAVAPSLPVQQAAVRTANSDSNHPFPPGTTMHYGAHIKAKVLSRQGTYYGQPVFLVATTPDSESRGRFEVTFWVSQGEPIPQVGDTFSGFANYVLVSLKDHRQIVAGRVPYATNVR